ncbi:MAG: toxin-antitoxin system, toxin component [Prevotella sp.]|nr:toxin-antitoxin system, toxin component [Candidatus Equicola faecalis]
MSNSDLKNIIDKACFIVGGYVFSRKENNIEIVSIASPNHVLLMSLNGGVLESSMDDIELTIVQEYWIKNKKYLTDQHYA